MANNTIVISRIQNRRGRRENLPQPLLPGEIALTADTEEVWIGSDPSLNVPSTRVYKDQTQGTAQGIIDNSIVGAVFTQNFVPSDFDTLSLQLVSDNSITLSFDDIKWDDTYRGSIINVIVSSPGTGYTSGNIVTAVSPTGSGFTGLVVDNGSGGIASITVTNPGRNYFAGTTTFSITGGTGGVLTVGVNNVHGYSVFIAANDDVDPNNTIANVVTAVEATGPGTLVGITGKHGALGGPFRFPGLGGKVFNSDVLLLDTQKEATIVTNLINRVHSTVPGAITGLVHTTLNIELTSSNIGNTFAEVLNVFSSTIETTNGTQVTLQSLTIAEGFQNLIVARVKGYEPLTGDAKWAYIRACVKNIGGTVSFIGALSSDVGFDAGAATWDITMSASANQVLIRVTGEVGKTIDWQTVTEISYPIDETAFVPVLPSFTLQLSDLTDVGVTTPTVNNLLVADGDSWESRPLLLDNLGDVNVGTPGAGQDGFVVTWDNGSSQFVLVAPPGAPSTSTHTTTNATPFDFDTAVGTSVSKLYTVSVIGRQASTGDTYWSTSKIGVTTNGGGTVTLVGSPVTDFGYSAGAAAWTVVISASTTFLRTEVTGEVAKTIDWKIQWEIV